MKRILFIFLLATTAISAQTITQSKEDVSKILCRKWIVDYVDFRGSKVPMNMSIILQFKPDNTCIATVNGEAKNGKWTHNERTKSVAFVMKAKVNILSLSEKEFTFGELETENRDTPEGAVFHAKLAE